MGVNVGGLYKVYVHLQIGQKHNLILKCCSLSAECEIDNWLLVNNTTWPPDPEVKKVSFSSVNQCPVLIVVVVDGFDL